MNHSPKLFSILQCRSPLCLFRFSADAENEQGEKCPICDSKTTVVRWAMGGRGNIRLEPPNTVRLEALLDNIRSGYNVGSIFRTSDGAGIDHLYLCGITPTPEHRKVAKTALGSQQVIRWSAHRNALAKALELKERGCLLVALEGSPVAGQSVFEKLPSTGRVPIVLIVGNERSGVDPGILDLCDHILSIPMHGEKASLNVVVAFGIAAYQLRQGSDLDSPMAPAK